MSKKFLTSIDLHKNELQNAVVHSLVTAPASGTAGQIYYNSTDKKLYQHDGTSWVCVGIAYALGTGTPSSNTVPITLSANGQVQDTITIAGAGGATLSFSNGTLTITTADNNTTYTFTGAASSTAYVITCTPSSGSAQTVTIPLAGGTNAGLMSPSEYTKLSGIESGAQKNVQGDFNQSDSSADDFIKNKPTIINYDTGTASDLSTGTSTTAKVWTPKVIHDHVAGASPVQTNENTTPYQFRPTPQCGSIEYLDQVVGGTLAVNQLSPITAPSGQGEGVTYTNNGDGTYTLNGTCTSASYIWLQNSGDFYVIQPNHKYFAACETNNTAILAQFILYGSPAFVEQIGGTVQPKERIISAPSSFTNYTKFGWVIQYASGKTYDNEKVLAQLFDLTQMFGSTIADYVYNLEQSTSGSGVAWLKQYYPSIFNSYQPYNAGTLESVEASAHVMTGFNQWDEDWELGVYSYITGNKSSGTSNIRSKNFIPVLSNTDYHIRSNYATQINGFYVVLYYDASKGYLGYAPAVQTSTNGTFTTPANCAYITFYVSQLYGTTYNNDICINVSSDRNGEYEAYKQTSYPLDSDLVLRGIPKLNNGVPYYDGDEYKRDGTVTRKYGEYTFTGSETWTWLATINAWITSGITGLKTTATTIRASNGLNCNCYVNGQLRVYSTYNPSITSSTDMNTMFPANSGLLFSIDETTETADPYDRVQKCYMDGTEEFVSSTVIPVGQTTYYPLTLKDTMPTSNGTYTLSLTVADGKPTLSWS